MADASERTSGAAGTEAGPGAGAEAAAADEVHSTAAAGDGPAPGAGEDGPMIVIQCSDGPHAMLREHAMMCGTLRNLLGDLEEEELDAPIPVGSTTTEMLKKVVDFCREYAGRPTTFTFDEEVEFRVKPFDGWEKRFVAVPTDTLFQMIMTASYLDIPMMLNITAKAAADIIKRSSPEEVKRIFGLKDSLTPEEEAAVCARHPWLRVDGVADGDGDAAAAAGDGAAAAAASDRAAVAAAAD